MLPDQRQFVIDLDDSGVRASPTTTLDKRYVERLVRQRVHQPVFRARALSAYGKRCAICTLKYAELLDAAHILPDGHKDSLPVVTNGMAMCTIHHRAYDQNFLGVSPDYTVHISPDPPSGSAFAWVWEQRNVLLTGENGGVEARFMPSRKDT
ncbi:HNH endonuclease, partial [Microcella pacifica]